MHLRSRWSVACLFLALGSAYARSDADQVAGNGAASPVLTIDEAVSAALKGNRRVESSGLDLQRAFEGTAAAKTQRLPQFNLYVLGGEALTEISFTVPRGALGVYPNVGPIPAQNSTIATPRTFTGLVLGQAVQPISQLWKVHLALLESKVGEQIAREKLRRQQQDTAHSVRDLYYQIARNQSQVESAAAGLKYWEDLQAETDRNLVEQTALKADSLTVRAKLSQQRYQLLSLQDGLQSQKEAFNVLLGRDLSTEFTVQPQPLPDAAELDLTAARQEALGQRAEIRESKLQIRKAALEVRRQRAEYLPNLSAHVTYLSFPNVNFVPQNIAQAGLMLQWQPFDWGQKRHQTESLKDEEKQAALVAKDAEDQVMADVNAKFRKLAEARALLDVAAAQQEAEREKMRVVTNRYGQKAALLSDVLQEQAALAQADADSEKALAGFWNAKAAFDYSLGRQ